jgi:hypothetical protein
MPPASPTPALRNCIRFGGDTFKLKTRDLRVAHERTLALLRAVTSFSTWKEIVLHVRPPARTAAQYKLHEFLGKPPPGVNGWTHRDQPFDRAALEARRIDLDPLLLDALARFGPARFASNASDSQGPWTALAWDAPAALVPPAWLDFCVEHAARTVEHWPQVELVLDSGPLELLQPGTRSPLPFQADTHYPPFRAGETYRLACGAHAWLRLPQRGLHLSLRLPFHDAGADFRDFVTAMDDALGQPLSRKGWYTVLVSKGGASQYERKLTW